MSKQKKPDEMERLREQGRKAVEREKERAELQRQIRGVKWGDTVNPETRRGAATRV